MPKAGFISLGCPKNLVDSEVMMGVLARNGYEFTPRAEEADVLVVNTCSFIAPAQKESIDTILEMAEHKKFGRAKKLIVAGCLVERYRDQILAQIPEVDAVVGTGEVENILAAVEGELRSDRASAEALPSYLYHDLTPRILSTPKHAAYMKIAEGCDHPCTFCIIPQLRGNFRSRRFESVVREAENLAAAGVREVTLIGQDTTSYGEDLGLRDGLALLLERLASVKGLQWVRSLYCYPNRVTQRLLDTIAAHPRIAKYMDMPLQHASRNILARMKRGSNGDAFLQLLGRIRRTIPGVALRTSFIVGFPGETDEDFGELCDFVKAAEFDWMGVFPYSDVDNASSFALDGKVNEDTIKQRQSRLMEIQQKISARKLRRFRGQRVTALVEGPSKDSPLVWEARLEGMAPEIDGKVYLNDIEIEGTTISARPGDVVTAVITETHEYDLVGRVVQILEVPRLAAASISANAPVQRVATGAALRVLG
ncbi:MAG TPA: 30S ribosomal protein S12 methylthiotransferase RimO [Candidatus Acidoferrales bacterium]|jgi:ribosomal protein S12 methylthiotransferase|nr:30S ribosomal protein S12 methylthiotransferase RimO [Candidatus Acidoferrales bacterium]